MLIFTDVVFIVGVSLLAFAASGNSTLKSLPLIFLTIFAFGSCLKRHVNYYKLNKKIY